MDHFKCPVVFLDDMFVRDLNCPKAVLLVIYWPGDPYLVIFTDPRRDIKPSDLMDPILCQTLWTDRAGWPQMKT